MKINTKELVKQKLSKLTPKILIVDDIVDNTILLEEVLNELNAEIIIATSGNQALEKIENNEFAIALIDVQMPEMDGFETTEKIKNKINDKLLPVIFISAIYSDTHYKIKGIKSGAVDFISKPIISDILLGKVKVFLDLYKQRKELELFRTQLENLVNERTKELAIAKEKAEEADRLKSAFLANISHELRTPMNAVMGFAELVNMGELDKDELKDSLEQIQINSETLLNLVENLMEISKIQSGNIDLNKKQVDVNEFLKDIWYAFNKKREHENKDQLKLELITDNSSNIQSINTDIDKLEAILSQLLKNALKFTDSGKIEFGYTNRNQVVEFFVRDTGTGIEKEKLQYIFEIFSKADKMENINRGAGLGLSIAKSMVNILGGKIWIDTDYKKGAAFYFTVPNDN